MDIVTKSTRKHFAVASCISCVVALASYEWLFVLVALWGVLAMGGIGLFGLKRQVLVSIQWGSFFGLTAALAFLIWGPLGLYG
ncbi:hypothetical protein [Neptunomonas phycophila]|uniref:hypothetical protein n=1 Tax=Neptunomonas phycophila TaxID=1572645 RepID=UPI000948F335|nr:hypothetical protein [Neptunomonas phycophila]